MGDWCSHPSLSPKINLIFINSKMDIQIFTNNKGEYTAKIEISHSFFTVYSSLGDKFTGNNSSNVVYFPICRKCDYFIIIKTRDSLPVFSEIRKSNKKEIFKIINGFSEIQNFESKASNVENLKKIFEPINNIVLDIDKLTA